MQQPVEPSSQGDQQLVATLHLSEDYSELASEVHRELREFMLEQRWGESVLPKITEVRNSTRCLTDGRSLITACQRLAKQLGKAAPSAELTGQHLSRPYTPWQLLALRCNMQPPPGGPARPVTDSLTAADAARQLAEQAWEPSVAHLSEGFGRQEQQKLRQQVLKIMESENMYGYPPEEFMRRQHPILESKLGRLGRKLQKAMKTKQSLRPVLTDHFGIRPHRHFKRDHNLSKWLDHVILCNQDFRDKRQLQVSDEDCKTLLLFTIDHARAWSSQHASGLAESIKFSGGLEKFAASLGLKWLTAESPGMHPRQRMLRPGGSMDVALQLEDLMTQAILEQQATLRTLTHPDWQLLHVPRTQALIALGGEYAKLGYHIKNFRRDTLAGALNWSLAASKQFPHAYFSVSPGSLSLLHCQLSASLLDRAFLI